MTLTTSTTSTTSPRPLGLDAAAIGYICHPSQLSWSLDDWIDSFPDNATYERSLLHCADSDGELTTADLRQLLAEHGFTTAELISDLADQAAAGHTTLPLWHAGQALTWLGY